MIDSNTMAILWTVNGTYNYSSITIAYPWVCASVLTGTTTSASQYHIQTGKTFKTITLSMKLLYFDFDLQNVVYNLYVRDVPSVWCIEFSVNDEYSCPPSGTTSNCTVCDSGYQLSASFTCVAGTQTNLYNIMNSVSNLYTPPVSPPISPIPSPLIPPTPPTSVLPILPVVLGNETSTSICFQIQTELPLYCQIYCSQRCSSCFYERSQCKACESFYFLNQDGFC